MANVSKPRARNSPGSPPQGENALEVSPAIAPANAERLDLRTQRRSRRTVVLATKVTPEFDQALRSYAQTDRVLLVEILEQALALYAAAREKAGR